jgi:RNA polymerase sigma-70 factor (ECF subfamily)
MVKKTRRCRVFFLYDRRAAKTMGDFEAEFADDDVLMCRAANHDNVAFGVLIHRHQTRVLRVACRLLGGDADAAADVVQDAFINIWKAAAQYQPEGRFRSYLLTVICHGARDRWRRRSDLSLNNDYSQFASSPGPESQTRATLFAEAIRRAVMQLPDTQREVFILSQFEGLRYREIADLLDCPEGTVASRKHLAVETLRRSLKAWNTEESDNK